MITRHLLCPSDAACWHSDIIICHMCISITGITQQSHETYQQMQSTTFLKFFLLNYLFYFGKTKTTQFAKCILAVCGT